MLPFRSRPLLRRALLWGGVAVVAFSLVSGAIFVGETEAVLVERFGKLVAVYDRPEDKGLRWKLPWPIDRAHRFSTQVRLFDPAGREVFTRDRKNLVVDVYLAWQIPPSADGAASEPTDEFDDRPVVRFYRALGSGTVAEARLENRLRSVVTTEVASVDLSELLTAVDSDSGPEPETTLPAETGGATPLGRLARRIKSQLGTTSDGGSLSDALGIEVVELNVKKLDLPLANRQAVFERMRSERKKIADRYRSSAAAEEVVIRARAERRAAELLAKATTEAARIRAEADGEAFSVLSAAAERNPEFFEFVQTLDAYETIFGENATLVLSADSPLWKLFVTGPETMGTSPRTADSDATTDDNGTEQ